MDGKIYQAIMWGKVEAALSHGMTTDDLPDVPHYTESVDAALTLIPSTWTGQILLPDHIRLWPYESGWPEVTGCASPLSLAICIAVAKAHEVTVD